MPKISKDLEGKQKINEAAAGKSSPKVETGSDSLLELPACAASLGKWPVRGCPAHRCPFLGG